jgi:hypothetical protein
MRNRHYRGCFGLIAMAFGSIFATGCQEALEGDVWNIHLVGTTYNDAECGYVWEGYEEYMDYRLTFDSSVVDVAIGPDIFAHGSISGCQIYYQSVVWSQDFDGYDVRWQLEGEATYRVGESGCNLDSNQDWLGTETFDIVSSDHPDLNAGCWFVLSTDGTYEGSL